MNPDFAAHIAQRDEILAHIRGILIDDLCMERELDEIDPDTPLFGTGLALDSLDALDLIACLYSRLGLSLQGASAHRVAMRTVNTLVDWIIEQQSEKNER
ncbi:MAG: acyl carrier protein [Proteobacteria bacterium]|nr:acyl carrier protein [Pseudomonadota bacterium]